VTVRFQQQLEQGTASYSNSWYTPLPLNAGFTSPILCDYPTLGNCQTLIITNRNTNADIPIDAMLRNVT